MVGIAPSLVESKFQENCNRRAHCLHTTFALDYRTENSMDMLEYVKIGFDLCLIRAIANFLFSHLLKMKEKYEANVEHLD